jgi:hypothetical protein
MMLPRVRFPVRRMLIVVAVSAGSLAFGSGFEVRYRSCHLCHNREQIDTKTVWFIPVTWRRAITTRFLSEAGHRHQWWQYSDMVDSPLIGCSRGCHARVYADGSMAPDGYQ